MQDVGGQGWLVLHGFRDLIDVIKFPGDLQEHGMGFGYGLNQCPEYAGLFCIAGTVATHQREGLQCGGWAAGGGRCILRGDVQGLGVGAKGLDRRAHPERAIRFGRWLRVGAGRRSPSPQ